jgi:putative zinc finger/helix-turn-helix YgiT family protein
MDTKIINVHEKYVIRGEEIYIDADRLVDATSNEPVFNEELDDRAVQLAFQQYRDAHDLVSADEVVELRHRFGLSQRDFAAMLGWSPTTVATYETGALPSKAKNNLLRALQTDPRLAETLYGENQGKMTPSGRQSFENNACNDSTTQQLQAAQSQIGEGITKLFVATNYTEFSGFTTFNLKKFLNAALFFINAVPELTKTKLNKLLFYADFKYFQNNAVSITGVPYARIDHGPVPDEYALLYGLMDAQALITSEETGYGQFSWDYFKALKPADQSVFTQAELDVLQQVIARFKDESAAGISEISHRETAWLNTPNSKQISYQHATNLQGV